MMLLSLAVLLLGQRVHSRVDRPESVGHCSCGCPEMSNLGTAPLVFNDPCKQGGMNNG